MLEKAKAPKNDTLKANAGGALPPHLRGKSTEVVAKPTITVSKPATITEAVPPVANVESALAKPMPAPEVKPVKQELEVAAANGSAGSATVPATTLGDGSAKVTTTLEKNVASLTTKVDRLESENWEMIKKVEQLVQAEERRKFLGTIGAKTPYIITVTASKNLFIACKTIFTNQPSQRPTPSPSKSVRR